MNNSSWRTILKLPQLFGNLTPDAEQQAARIWTMERNIALPVKVMVICVLIYYMFFSNWFDEMTLMPRQFALEVVRRFFLFYVAVNVAVGFLLLGMAQLPLRLVQWAVFIMALIDGLFLSAITLATGEFDSVLFWVFPALIVRNAISVPMTTLQIVLNCLVSVGYLLAGLVDVSVDRLERTFFLPDNLEGTLLPGLQPDNAVELIVLRMLLLLLLTACCYGVQVLFDKQRLAEEEAGEFALRREQMRTSSQLAAEIAHQLKNPLGIINNAAFNLQRNVKEGKATITQQIKIIREEVERSDRIITDLMGYAKLADGKVEKLVVTEELDRTIDLVFPAAAHFDVQVHRDYAPVLPPLMMQRTHLSEIFVNLLQNAREATNGRGAVEVSAHYGPDYSVVVTIADNGTGIPTELHEKIFQPYFTTKDKGTGLGLAIVKHNTEIYGGTVRAESELGKGSRFVLHFPAKSLMRLRK